MGLVVEKWLRDMVSGQGHTVPAISLIYSNSALSVNFAVGGTFVFPPSSHVETLTTAMGQH